MHGFQIMIKYSKYREILGKPGQLSGSSCFLDKSLLVFPSNKKAVAYILQFTGEGEGKQNSGVWGETPKNNLREHSQKLPLFLESVGGGCHRQYFHEPNFLPFETNGITENRYPFANHMAKWPQYSSCHMSPSASGYIFPSTFRLLFDVSYSDECQAKKVLWVYYRRFPFFVQ